VLEKIVSHKLHRVYVVDADEKPCGVVTCTDVLKLVTQRAQLRGASPAASSAAAADSQQQDQGQQQQQQQAEVMSVP
jgi:CBS-domain-containing membrane protein